jgi:hypothetical protein
MSYYECKKCSYKTISFRNIKKHINIKKSCIKNFICLELTNDEILIMSLIPFIEKKQNFDFNKIKNHKYTYKNKSLLLDELNNIEKNKIKRNKYINSNVTNIGSISIKS